MPLKWQAAKEVRTTGLGIMYRYHDGQAWVKLPMPIQLNICWSAQAGKSWLVKPVPHTIDPRNDVTEGKLRVQGGDTSRTAAAAAAATIPGRSGAQWLEMRGTTAGD
jgi:hypothetical protein